MKKRATQRAHNKRQTGAPLFERIKDVAQSHLPQENEFVDSGKQDSVFPNRYAKFRTALMEV